MFPYFIFSPVLPLTWVIARILLLIITEKQRYDSCQCMTKPTEMCEVISLQLIKINEKKKKSKDR